MGRIKIEKFDKNRLKELGLDAWPIWEKEISRFPWSYDEKEVCYILEGKAKVKTEDGEVVEFGPGDKVSFPKGLSCTWDITSPIKKHYKFG